MRGKNVEARQRCSHNCAQAQRLAITLTWIDFLCAWMAQWEVKKKVFPLHGFILIFIVPLHTESTNVRENGLDICSNSLLFLSLHPSFSLSLFPFLCSHSPDTWCLPLPDRGGKKWRWRSRNERMMEGVGTLCCYSFRLLIKHQWNVKAISSCKACLTFMWSCSLSQRATPDPPSVLHILLNVTLPRSWNSLWLWGFFSCKPKRMWLRFFPLGIFIKVCTFFPPIVVPRNIQFTCFVSMVSSYMCVLCQWNIYEEEKRSQVGFPPFPGNRCDVINTFTEI